MGFFDDNKDAEAKDGLAKESADEIKKLNDEASKKLSKLGLKEEAGEPDKEEEKKEEDKPVTAGAAPAAPKAEAKPEDKKPS